MQTTIEQSNESTKTLLNRKNRFILFYSLIIIFYLGIIPWISTSTWVSSLYFHISIETTGSLISLITGIACFMYYLGFSSRYFLLISLGFFICGIGSLFHGIFNYTKLIHNNSDTLVCFFPEIYTASRISLALIITTAGIPMWKKKIFSVEKRTAYLLSGLAVAIGFILPLIIKSIHLDQIFHTGHFIGRPVDLFIAFLFLIAFFLILKRYLVHHDTFSGMLIACLLLNFCGQAYLAFSQSHYDVCSEVAHWTIVISYCMPIVGVALQELGMIKSSQRELAIRKSIEHNLEQKTIELKRTNKELESFTYVSSHDLKSPLRGIDNLAIWIEQDLSRYMNDETKLQMKLLRTRVKRMEDLLDGLISYSSVGKVTYDIATISTKTLINEVYNSLNPLSDFKLSIQDSLPEITTAYEPLRNVFMILIGNTLKYHNRKEGKITIYHKDCSEFLEFSVSDDGPGIEKMYHEKIFQIFQTLKPRDEIESRGVGLALAKKIVENFYGEISIISQKDKGATFSFTWPKTISYKKNINYETA